MDGARVIIESPSGDRVVGHVIAFDSDEIRVRVAAEGLRGPVSVWLPGDESLGPIRFTSIARDAGGGVRLCAARLGTRGRQRLRELLEHAHTPAPATPTPARPSVRAARSEPPRPTVVGSAPAKARRRAPTPAPAAARRPVAPPPARRKTSEALDVVLERVPVVQCDAQLVWRALSGSSHLVDLKGLDVRAGRPVLIEIDDAEGRPVLLEAEVQERRGSTCRLRLSPPPRPAGAR